MNPDTELELKEALSSLTDRYKLPGYILLYPDEGKIKAMGEFSFSALAPLLMKYFAERMTK